MGKPNVGNQGTVTEDIVTSVTGLSRSSITDIRKELQTLEPNLDKWIKESVKEDIQGIKFSGVTIHSDDAVRTIGGILIQAKIEGFLMSRMADDREWCDKHFVDSGEQGQGVPYRDSVNALLAGLLDKSTYDNLEKSMTDQEKKDPKCWKRKALDEYKKVTDANQTAKKIRQHLQRTRNDKGDSGGGEPGPTQPPQIDIRP